MQNMGSQQLDDDPDYFSQPFDDKKGALDISNDSASI